MRKIQKADIEKILPEIQLVQNKKWREIITGIWQEAYEMSNWASIEEAAFHLDAPSCSLIIHTRAVTLAAMDIAERTGSILGIGCNMDEIITLCLLHDVCKLLEIDPNSGDNTHAKKSAMGKYYQHGFMSGFFAQKYGLPEKIVGTLIAHTDKSSVLPDSIEGICMYYADQAIADQAFLQDGAKLIMSKF